MGVRDDGSARQWHTVARRDRTRLAITGPYRSVRNPMALAGLLQTVGVGLVVGSWMVCAIAVAGAVVWNVFIRPAEEADLAARFGEPYRRYAEHVRCWIPVFRWRQA